MARRSRADLRAENDARSARIAAQKAEAQQTYANNRCPLCGNGVYVNNSLSGWI
jgi:hypothetical protein